MAADGRSCQGDLITTDRATKLSRAPDGSIVGCAGDRVVCDLVHQWFRDGEKPERLPEFRTSAPPDGTLFDCLILRPDGSVWFMESHFLPVSHMSPASIGTGAEIALGLMLAGWGPANAVEIVAERVVSVGGEIIEWKPGKERK